MQKYVALIFILPVLIICCQLYTFTVSREGREKQERCQILGIVYMTSGIVALVFHNVILVFSGIILIMMGLRLIAHGLDRIGKKTYIDKYTDDN